MVAPGGTYVVVPRGACMVAPGGHAWLLWGGACMVAPRGHAWDTMRYGDTVNEQAVHILLECILVLEACVKNSVHQGGVCLSACWDTLQEADPPGSRPPRKETPPRKQILLSAVHAGRYSQQAGGKHPTGMHSCWQCNQLILSLRTTCSSHLTVQESLTVF